MLRRLSIRRGTLGYIRNRKTEEKIIQNRNSSCWSWELLSSALTSTFSSAFVGVTTFLTHFMLVQIFMGSFIFIPSEVQINLTTNFEMALIKILWQCSVLSHCSFLPPCPLSYCSTTHLLRPSCVRCHNHLQEGWQRIEALSTVRYEETPLCRALGTRTFDWCNSTQPSL